MPVRGSGRTGETWQLGDGNPGPFEQLDPLAVGDEQAGFAPGDDDAADAGRDDQLTAASWPRLAPRAWLERAVHGRAPQPRIIRRKLPERRLLRVHMRVVLAGEPAGQLGAIRADDD